MSPSIPHIAAIDPPPEYNSQTGASLRASARTCPASYRGVCRARVPYAPGCRGNPVDFPGVSWDACRGRCPHPPAFLNPFFSFSLRKKRTGSIFQEKKEGIQNRKRIPCRHRVRRSQLHSVSAGAAKTPYPQPSSSFPNCDRFTGSQFGHLEFYNAARYLDDGGQAACYGYGNTMNPHKKRAASWPLLYFRFHVLGQKRTSIG